MERVEKLLEKLFAILDRDQIEEVDEEKLRTVLEKEFLPFEREELSEVLGSLLGEVSKMAENPKEYFFSNDQEKLAAYLEEKNKNETTDPGSQ